MDLTVLLPVPVGPITLEDDTIRHLSLERSEALLTQPSYPFEKRGGHVWITET